MKKERVAWETWKSLLELLNQRNIFPQQLNGLHPGEELLRRSSSLSLIEKMNSMNMMTTSNHNLPPKSPPLTTNSCFTTSPCAMKLQQDNIFSSQIITDSAVSIQPSSCRMESSQLMNCLQAGNLEKETKQETNQKLATDSMPDHARTAANQDMEKRPVRTVPNEIYGLQPKYL